ncbi:MAG: hypothetical protein ACI84C_001429 [Flavobacteriales bacterium]|jgi:hypothetical protein
MDLSYQLTEEDFMEYQMFQSSNSEPLKKRRLISRVILSLFYIAIAAYFKLIREQSGTAMIFAGAGVVWYFFYPTYAKWRYKNHFKRHIKANYQDRIGKSATLSIVSDGIDFDDSSGNAHVKAEALAHLIELKDYFLVTIDTGLSLIVPKHAIENQDDFKNQLMAFDMQYHDEREWIWS